MLRSPTIDARAARKVFDAVARRGIAPDVLCRAAGADLSLAADRGGRIPFEKLVALYEGAAAATRDQSFGLHLADESEAEKYDLLGYLVLNSDGLATRSGTCCAMCASGRTRSASRSMQPQRKRG
jgi:hypothetical protein